MSINNTHIYRSRSVILDMVDRRGYDNSSYQHFTIEDINSMMNLMTSTKTSQKYTVTPFDMVFKHKEADKYLHIRYFFGTKLKVNTVENIINTMVEEEQFNTEDDEIICIVDEKISNEAMFDNQLDGLFKKMGNKYYTQVFEISKLIISIMEHEYVPEHTIITTEEKQKLLERFDIATFTQLPVILKVDPVAKFIGMRRGDVCKIIRPSETAGRYEIYRYCQ